MPFPCSFASHHCKIWHYNPAEEEEGVGSAYNPAPVRKNGFHLDSKEPDWSKLPPQGRQPQHRDLKRYCRRLRTPMNKSNEVSNSLMKTFPQEAEVPKAANTRKNRENVNEQLFVATERNAKLRYEGYKKLSEM